MAATHLKRSWGKKRLEKLVKLKRKLVRVTRNRSVTLLGLKRAPQRGRGSVFYRKTFLRHL